MHYVNPLSAAMTSPSFPARRGDVGIAPDERTGKRVRIMGVGDGVLPWNAVEQMPLGYDVPHTATTKRPAFAGLLVYIIQFFFPCCAFMRRS